MKVLAATCAALMSCAAGAADLSPTAWPQEARQKAEQQEFMSWSPSAPALRQGKAGMISATVSPVAVEAGLQTLRQGGSAADAAAAVALTQITTQLGSVVSYAGIVTAIYYDAKTGKVYALDAGYGSYRDETDAASIPPSDISALTGGPAPAAAADLGRQTLVPGFMAGIEALQKRFGRLALRDTLAPAIFYAEHGVKISPTLAYFFQVRQKQMARTPEGRRFLEQAGKPLPQTGDIFRQIELADTLRAVAQRGAQVMYTGDWAREFVKTVRREGGKASPQDLALYRPVWSEAASTTVFGHAVYTNAGSSFAPYQLLTALDAAEALKLDRRGPYWSDRTTFRALMQLTGAVTGAPQIHPQIAATLSAKGIDVSPDGQRRKAYAEALAAALPSLYGKADGDTHHSNAIVVADKDGNIAVVTHTINSVIWGGSGIVVGGIPIPDSAGFQQSRLAQVKPGARLPNEIADTLVLDGSGKPVLAGAVIGTSMLPEVLRVIVSHVAQRQPLAAVAAAPPLLINPDPKSYALPLGVQPVILPSSGYDAAFVEGLKSDGVTVVQMPDASVAGIRGTLALVGFEGSTKSAPETPGVMVFTGAE